MTAGSEPNVARGAEWNGVHLDSLHERNWLEVFAALKLPWERSSEGCREGLHNWKPDFGLHRENLYGTVWVEVKPGDDPRRMLLDSYRPDEDVRLQVETRNRLDRNTMFQAIRSKIEVAEKISTYFDALLYLERIPPLLWSIVSSGEDIPRLTLQDACLFGYGAVWGSRETDEPSWLWSEAYLWFNMDKDRWGLRLKAGPELILTGRDFGH